MAVSTIAIGVFADVLRKKVLYVLLLFAMALVLAIPALPSFGVGVRVDLFRDLALGLASLFAVVIAIAVGVGQIPSEVERRTVYNVLSKPVSRTAFVAGKLLGVVLTMFVVVLAMVTIAFAATRAYFGTADGGLFIAGWAIFLEASVVGAFVVAASTFATPPITTMLAVVFYFVGHVKSSLSSTLPSTEGVAALPGRLLSYLLPSLENFNVNDLVAHGVQVPASRIGLTTLYGGLFVVAFFLVGAVIFGRRDL